MQPIDRRDLMRWTVAVAAAATLPAIGCGRQKKPNVLFIAVDDLNDWIGCLGGHPQARTPNLDRLAARGVLFANAHAPASTCRGSRTAILTGLAPSTTGIFENTPGPLPDAVTLPQHFMAGGYRAEGGGKLFHGRHEASWQATFSPDEPSWAEMRRQADDGYGLTPGQMLDWGPIDVRDDELADGKLVAWAEERLRGGFDGPFFLGVGFYRPHLPWYVPRRYFEPFPPAETELPPPNPNDPRDLPRRARVRIRTADHRQVVQKDQWRHAVSSYLAAIFFLDAMVGRVISALDEGPYAENTIVVLWSDHGFSLGEKTHWRKFHLWERVTHVPLIVVAPGVAAPGRCERAVTLLDVYPTLVDLCDLEPVAGLDGRTLRPWLEDPEAPRNRPAVTSIHPGSHAVRSNRWRYIVYADEGEELYDHRTDPNEWRNLASFPRYAKVKEKLRRWLPSS